MWRSLNELYHPDWSALHSTLQTPQQDARNIIHLTLHHQTQWTMTLLTHPTLVTGAVGVNEEGKCTSDTINQFVSAHFSCFAERHWVTHIPLLSYILSCHAFPPLFLSYHTSLLIPCLAVPSLFSNLRTAPTLLGLNRLSPYIVWYSCIFSHH